MPKVQLTTLTIIVLVVLRLAIGWHFFKEGSRKDDSFTSQHFLGASKVEMFRNMVPDAKGEYRLHPESTKGVWETYQNQANSHYGFDDKQKKACAAACKQAQAQLSWVLLDIDEDLTEADRELARLEKASQEKMTNVKFRKEWHAKEKTKWNGKRAALLRKINGVWDKYEVQVASIATDEQMATRGILPLPEPGNAGFLNFVDAFIPWLVFLVGVCLVLGLFTRVAAVAGAGFLFSVIATQPFWIPGAADTFYQSVEMLSLLLLAAVGAGRFAGLDFFIRAGIAGCCSKSNREGTKS